MVEQGCVHGKREMGVLGTGASRNTRYSDRAFVLSVTRFAS